MRVQPAGLPGLLEVFPAIHRDSRGSFRETWSRSRYLDAGMPEFVQDNLVVSRWGVLRGLHYQLPREQGKLVTVALGEVYDVAVDVRVGSPTFGRWAGFSLSAEEGPSLYVPPGFAHGYAVVSDVAIVAYKCSDYYEPAAEKGLLWSDPAVGIDWPLADPHLSEKDRAAPPLAAIPPESLPRYEA
jgi:dTDP-4-dehydrorhamnose 3,5-epimerase